MRKEKGITLIALIITIIVMIILVAVTVNVALNGGLFEKAEKGSTGTQKEADKEELTSLVIAAYNEQNGKVKFDTLDSSIAEAGWSGQNGEYTSPKKNTFYVDEKGNISTNKKTTMIELGKTVPTFTFKSTVDTSKDYSAFRYHYITSSGYESEESQADFYNVNNPEDGMEFGVENSYEGGEYYIYVNKWDGIDGLNQKYYIYILKPSTIYNDTEISETGWYEDLGPDENDHAIVEKVDASEFPTFEGYQLSNDVQYGEGAISTINEYFTAIFDAQ